MFRLETYCELYVRKVLLVQRESVLLQLFLPEVRPMGSVRFALRNSWNSWGQPWVSPSASVDGGCDSFC